MSSYRNYGSGYYQEYKSEQLEYPGYDDNWVLGVSSAAAPYVHDPAYSSRRYYGSGYGNYGSGYSSKYRPRSSYGSSYSSNLVAHPFRHHPQPSILTQLFPSRRHNYSTSTSGYRDDVKLKVEICCLECKSKMLDALRKMKGVYDVHVEGAVHAMVTVTGDELKPKKILKKVRKIIKAADYWSDWHYSDGVAPHHSGFHSGFLAHPSYSSSPRLRHRSY